MQTPATPAPLQHVFVATFAIKPIDPKEKPVSETVEVPHTQDPKLDTAAAWSAIRAKHPKVPRDNIRRTAGKLVSRPGGLLPVIEVRPGETIRQLFPDGSEFEASRHVGTVMFDGAKCDVILRHLRSKSLWSITLRQSGGIVVNFSEQTTVMRLASELPNLIANSLGDAGTGLELFLKFLDK